MEQKLFPKHLILFEKIRNDPEKKLMQFGISKASKNSDTVMKKYIKNYTLFYKDIKSIRILYQGPMC